MKVALAQISPKLSPENFDLHYAEIEKAISAGAKLVVFPELSMNGYMLMDSVFEDAFSLEALKCFEEWSSEIDIVIGAATKEAHRIYNSALYFSKGSLLTIHHKKQLPNYGMFQEARFFFKGEHFTCFTTPFGRVMMVVCEDLWHGETIEEISKEKPDMVIVIANSPSRDFSTNGLLGIQKQWMRILSTTVILSGAHLLFVNRVGFEDGMGFWGGSMVLDPSGKVVEDASLFKRELLFGEIELRQAAIRKYQLRGE